MFEKFKKPKIAPTLTTTIDNVDRIIGQIGTLSNQLETSITALTAANDVQANVISRAQNVIAANDAAITRAKEAIEVVKGLK